MISRPVCVNRPNPNEVIDKILMRIRDLHKIVGLGVAVLAMPNQAAAAEGKPMAGRRPNIIMILSDDQGYGDLGRNGNPVLKTPNLEKMYDEGIHFEDFHVSPACSPTRASLMSGKHEFKNGVTHTIYERERMSLKSTTIAQMPFAENAGGIAS